MLILGWSGGGDGFKLYKMIVYHLFSAHFSICIVIFMHLYFCSYHVYECLCVCFNVLSWLAPDTVVVIVSFENRSARR